MKVVISIATVTLVLTMIASCAKFEEKNHTVEEIDGAKFIHNAFPKHKDDQILSLDYKFTIGADKPENDNYLLYGTFDATIDKEGNIYALDSRNHRIQVYSPDGTYIKSIGNKGKGPGEFESIISLDIASNSDLYVNDQGNRMIHRFDQNGKFIESSRITQAFSQIRITHHDQYCTPIMRMKLDINFPEFYSQIGFGRPAEIPLKSLIFVNIMNDSKKEFGDALPEENGLNWVSR